MPVNEPSQKKPRILLVDDNPIILEIEKSVLKVEDYDIETASDGTEAIEKVKSFKPDLILLDIMMPAIDGYEVCARLKTNERTKNIRLDRMINLFMAPSFYTILKASQIMFQSYCPLAQLKVLDNQPLYRS